MEISDDSEVITDSEEEHSIVLEKLSPLIECKTKRKMGHSTQQATIYFTLLNAGTLVSVFVIFVLDIQCIINAESQIISLCGHSVPIQQIPAASKNSDWIQIWTIG